jgi:hypothetical protein
MLIPREELRFDFGDARFDLASPSERKLLAWIFSQFLYGEITGVQCGWWLYKAPSLEAASFLARQANEELSHVRRVLKILSLLGQAPEKAHGAIRFLSTGMMGHSWGEHVAIEMALGEGLVLPVFYAMAETIPDPEIQRILETSIVEEERHVTFGEKETVAWLGKYPGSRKLLLGLSFIQLRTLGFVKKFVMKTLTREVGPSHPILARFGDFYDHTVKSFETRIERLGLSDVPLRQLSFFSKLTLVTLLPLRMAWARLRYRTTSLTETYLEDPALKESEVTADRH